MKLLYVAYDLDFKLKARSADIAIKDYKSIEALARDLAKRATDYDLIALPLNEHFLFTRVIDSIIYFIISDEFPSSYLNSRVIEINSSYISINKRELRQEECNSLNLNYEILENVVQSLIDNISNADGIYLDRCSELELKLILSLIPKSYLNRLSYSKAYDTKIRLNKRGEYYFNLEDSSINNHLEIKRYAYTVVDNLKISLNNAISYAKEIDRIIEKKKIGISSICDLLNLIDGKLERITSLEKLSEAVSNLDGMDYNKGFVATIIFTSLNKYKLDKKMLIVYRFVYENVEASRDYIIKGFFDNLDIFIDNSECDYLAYLDRLEYNAPFPLIDYLYYLRENGLYNSYFLNSFSDFKKEYMLLDLICRDLRLNRGTLVPNEELLYFIDYNIKDKRLDRVDIILKRIERLNKRARDRLISISIEGLMKDANALRGLELDYMLRLLERLRPAEFVYYFKRLYFISNKNEIIDKLNEREYKNINYYKEATKLLRDDIANNEIIDLMATRRLYNDKCLSLETLSSYYTDYYLDKRKNDHGVFLDKLILYLKENDNLDLMLEVYNRFYSNLAVGYKDASLAIKKINDLIYTHYKEIYSDKNKYLMRLDLINDKLSLAKIEANPYYALLKLGEGLKNGSDSLKARLIKDICLSGLLNGFKASELTIFLAYYSNDLFYEYFNRLMVDGYDDYSFIAEFRGLFDPLMQLESFKGRLECYFKDNSYNEGELFYFILASSLANIKIYKRISLSLLDRLSKKEVKLYFKDYLSYLHSDNINIDYKNKMKAFIRDYIDNRLGLIAKIALMMKNR